MKIQNGRIESTSLGWEDHGILTCWLHLTFSGTGQSFGGYALDAPPAQRFGSDRQSSAHCGFWVARILKTVGVTKWEDLKGKYIRVARMDDFALIAGIGHITDDSLWFYPKREIAKEFPQEGAA